MEFGADTNTREWRFLVTTGWRGPGHRPFHVQSESRRLGSASISRGGSATVRPRVADIEHAILVSATAGRSVRDFEVHIAELRELAHSAGTDIIDVVTQNRGRSCASSMRGRSPMLAVFLAWPWAWPRWTSSASSRTRPPGGPARSASASYSARAGRRDPLNARPERRVHRVGDCPGPRSARPQRPFGSGDCRSGSARSTPRPSWPSRSPWPASRRWHRICRPAASRGRTR